MHLTRKLSRSIGLLVFSFVFLPAVSTSVRASDDPTVVAEKEANLIAILQSDAAKAEKAITCKRLAIYGSAKAVPELAKLLADEELASWSRIALEAIPGQEAEDALRKATDSLHGNLLIGTINSIGVRRIANATDQLKALMRNTDSEVASASAVALGHIGSEAAVKALSESLANSPQSVRSSVAEGCVLCAERSLSEGKTDEAIKLYDLVRATEVPRQRIVEATRGAILARKDKGQDLLREQLRSKDKIMFQLALGTAREIPGRDVDQLLANELSSATPDRGALIIDTMADRGETVILSVILKSAQSGPKQIRVAAIAALGRVGNPSCVSSMLESAIDKDTEIAETAKKALAEISGEAINKEIVARLSKPEEKYYALLVELVGQRRIEALPSLVKALDHSNFAVRTAALNALGATVPAEKLSLLISQVVSPKSEADADVAQLALKTACVRMPDREACAGELAAALERSSVPTKIVILRILGAVAGTKALNTIGAAAKSKELELQDVGSELLGEWMTIDGAPVLLDLAKSAPAEKFQIRAMRGYIKVVRQFTIPEPQRMEMCKLAFEASRRTAEQKLVLEVLKRYPHIETLKLAINALQIAELKDDAMQATLVIAQKIGNNAVVKELLTSVDLNHVKLEIVKAEYGSGATQKDVTEILQKQVSDLPLITLASESYNETFGGDPTPGTAKKLKIRYRMNDKAGDASFDENSLIVLPMPK